MPLSLGCTRATHARLGVHAVVNARAGRQDLNDRSVEEIELYRDARRVRDRIERRVRFYQFTSKAMRRAARTRPSIAALLSTHGD